MRTNTKKKRQQRAQSRLALAQQRKIERERRKVGAAHREEKRWAKALRQLASLGATLLEGEEDEGLAAYRVIYEGQTYPFHSRSQVRRWVTRSTQQHDEQQMSWAERHVQWMIENNCDDHGNPWPEE